MPRSAAALALVLAVPFAVPLAAQGGFGPDLRSAWPAFAERYDADHDGVIHAHEYPRGRGPFRALDHDRDGVLTVNDFRPHFKPAKPSKRGKRVSALHAVGQAFVRRLDADHDGQVTRSEWDIAIDDLDSDADGTLTGAEAAKAMPQRGPGAHELDIWLRSFDYDHDHRVDRDELAKAFATLDIDDDGTVSNDERPMFDEEPDEPSDEPPPRQQPAHPLRVGMQAPDFELPTRADANRTISLSRLIARKPVALIFGSLTDPALRHSARRLRAMQAAYGDRVEFVLVYLREAHALDSTAPSAYGVIEDPIDDAERRVLASRCSRELDLADFHIAVDHVDDTVGAAYGAWPDRLVLVGNDGKVLWCSPSVPLATDPDDLEQAIRARLTAFGAAGSLNAAGAANATRPGR